MCLKPLLARSFGRAEKRTETPTEPTNFDELGCPSRPADRLAGVPGTPLEPHAGIAYDTPIWRDMRSPNPPRPRLAGR